MSLGEVSVTAIFKIRVGRMFGPDALDRFKLRSNCSIKGIVNLRSGIGVAIEPSRSGSTPSGTLVNTNGHSRH